MFVRILMPYEIEQGVIIARGVFEQGLQATVPQPEMVQAFYDYAVPGKIAEKVMQKELVVWGAFEENQLCGISAMTIEGHITMLYVHGYFLRRGAGKKLLKEMKNYAVNVLKKEYVTVNAMPVWTANFFLRQGFTYIKAPANMQAPFVSLKCKVKSETDYPVKKISDKALVILAALGIGFSIVLAIGLFIYLFITF